MTTDRKQPDDGDEAQLAWLFTSAHEAPAMRPEFVAALSQRLDEAFAGRTESLGHTAGPTSSASGSGTERSAEPTAEPSEEVALPPGKPAHRRPRRRWALAIATAASLTLALAILSNPPAFAAALRAIVTSLGELTSGILHFERAEPVVADTPPDRRQVGGEVIVIPPAPPAERVQTEPELMPPLADHKEQAVAEPKSEPENARQAEAWEPFDAPLPDDELSQRVDEQLAALWQSNGIRPVGPATDAEFMRRVYLDLLGRIPTVSEAQEFLHDPSPGRRERLVDLLLEHHDHATHLAAVWRGVLLPDDVDLSRFGGPVKFEEWLAERFATNRSYDEIVRELLLAEGRVSEAGPLLFYAALRLEPEELAARTSRAFLGVRMECAQCHDHPFDEVSQHDFWSFAAFFARISRPRGKMEMTSPVLAVRDNQQGEVMIPDSDEVVAPRLPASAVAKFSDPVHSDEAPRRAQLVDWLTAPNNGQFARATVNRVWALLFGRGLVEPVDDMRPANPAIAPEVLETLSRDFAASGFDLRRLLRALVLTRTYQLSSRSAENDSSRTLCFAQLNMKSLTAEQLYDCIAVATRRASLGADAMAQPGLMRFDDTSRQAFVEKFRAPAGQVTDYHAGIPQALTLMHGGLIHSATDVATSGLLKSLAAPFFSDIQRLDTLFLATLSRYPTDAERELMLQPIARASNSIERQQALGDVLWALLNSAEFTFNH